MRSVLTVQKKITPTPDLNRPAQAVSRRHGYYNRLDVPGLKINRKQLTPITEEGLPDTGGNIAAPGD